MKARAPAILVASFLLYLLAIVLWSVRGERAGAPEVPPLAARDEVHAAARPEPESRAAETRRAEPAPEPVPSSLPSPKLATIKGRCLSAETKQPLAGCTVKVGGFASNHTAMALHGPVSWMPPEAAITGDDGRFEISFDPPPPYQYSLDVQAPGRVPRTARWGSFRRGQVEDLGDIALARGHEVKGIVVDDTGSPVPKVGVSLRNLPLPIRDGMAANDRRAGWADEAGRFRVTVPIPAGTWSLDVSGQGIKLARPDSVTVTEDGGAPPDLTVVVKRMPSISGIVVDEEGRPVNGVNLNARLDRVSGRQAAARTREDGRFVMYAAGDDLRPVAVEVSDPGPCEPAPATAPQPWGTTDLRIVLRRALSLDLTVVESGTGTPVEEFSVRCHGTSANSSSYMDLRLGGKHPAGRLTIDKIWRGKNVLVVFPKDPSLRRSQPIEFDATDAGVPPMRIEVDRLSPLEVRVTRKSGKPVQGTRVELVDGKGRKVDAIRQANDDRQGWVQASHDRLPDLLSAAATDENGRARVFGPAGSTTLVVRVLGPGHEPLVREGVAIVADPPLVIVIPEGASFAGTLAPQGVLALSPKLFLRGGEDPNRTLRERTFISVSPAGLFEASNLTAGEYEVIFSVRVPYHHEHGGSGTSPLLEPPLARVTLVDGETTRLHLDASRFLPGRVQGRVLLHGAVPSPARVALSGKTQGPSGSSWLAGQFVPDADGNFVAEPLLPGTYRLQLYVGDIKAKSVDPIQDQNEFLLEAGAKVERVFHLERARLRIRLLEPDGKTPLAKTKCLVTAGEVLGERTTDENGFLVLDPAPTVEVRLFMAGRGGIPPVQIPAGQKDGSVDVVVPAAKAR